MSWLTAVLRELFALFVDDVAFSAAIVAWLALVAVAASWLPDGGLWRAPVLFVGCAAILMVGASRAPGRRRSDRPAPDAEPGGPPCS